VAKPGAGNIDATSTTSRQIQFALKLIWQFANSANGAPLIRGRSRLVGVFAGQ
jgi:hypothetical protein